jgi:probable rRNA maturation factor
MATKAQSKIYLFYNGVKFSLRNRTVLKSFIVSIFKKEKKKLGSITYIFSTDKAVLKINRSYLKHNYLTDIITFPLSEPGKPIVADIYISVERVLENSMCLNTSLTEELHRVIFHGALHLCGYSDKTKSEKIQMRSKENFYLSRYFAVRFT